jgi:hypothetical protein
MIVIFNETNGKMEFESYESLFKYIKKQIKDQEPLEDGFIEGQEDWNFIVHSPARLSAVYQSFIKAVDILITPQEKEAYENKLNLLEMYKGDTDTPIQIVLRPDINVHEMKKNWCRDYCLEHGYTVSERKFKTTH